MEPMMIIEMGIVAKQMFDAMDCPASPAMIKSIGICAPRVACARIRIMTVRRGEEIAWVMSKL
jgi:hypothetical protein